MGRITLFTENHCEQSAIVKAHLNLFGIPFCEINLSDHPERRRHMIQLSNDVDTPQIFFNERRLTMKQLEEQWSSWKHRKEEWDESFRHQFSCEVSNLADPVDPRLAKPTKQGNGRSPKLAPCPPDSMRLPDFSQWSRADLTRQLLQVTKHPYVRKCITNKAMGNSRVKTCNIVPCFRGREALSAWKDIFGTTSDDQTLSFFHALFEYGLVHRVSGKGYETAFWTLHPYCRSHMNKYVVFNDLVDAKEQPTRDDAEQLVLGLWHQMDHLWNTLPHENIRENKKFQYFEEDICRLQVVSLAADGVLNDSKRCIAFGLNLFHVMLRHAILLDGTKESKASAGGPLRQLPIRRPSDFNVELPRFLDSIRYRVGQDVISLLGLSNWLLYGNYRATCGPSALACPSWLRALIDRRSLTATVKTDVRIVLALSWGTVSSPKIIPYHPEALDEELKWTARTFCDQFVRLDEDQNVVMLPQHFDWYRRDFSGGSRNSTSAIMEHVVNYLTNSQIQTLERMHRSNMSKRYRLFPHQIGITFVGHNWTKTAPANARKSVREATNSVSSSSDESSDLVSASPDDDIQSQAMFSYVSALSENTWGLARNKAVDYDYSVRSGFDIDADGMIRKASQRSVFTEESEFQQVVHAGGRQLLGEGDAWMDSASCFRQGSLSSL